MGIITGLLQFVLVIVCILLVCVILLQRNKGAGAGVTFGGGEAVFGADMGNVLTRSTIVLGVLFLAITIALSIINARSHRASTGSVVDGLGTAPVQTLPAPAPEAPAADEAAGLPAEADAAAAAEAADDVADDVAEDVAEEPAAPVAETAPEAAPASADATAPAEAAAVEPEAPAEDGAK